MMIGAGNVLKKHAADHARRAAATDEEAAEEDDLAVCSHISFESAHSQCMENCGSLTLAVVCRGRAQTSRSVSAPSSSCFSFVFHFGKSAASAHFLCQNVQLVQVFVTFTRFKIFKVFKHVLH